MSINPPAGPVPGPADPPSPAAARVRVRRWHQDGSTYQAIATAAGLDRATVRDLATGRRQPKHGTAAAVLAVPGDAIARARLDAGGTRLRLRALHVMGHGSARIARALGVREMTIRQIVRGDARTVSPRLRDQVADEADGAGGVQVVAAVVAVAFQGVHDVVDQATGDAVIGHRRFLR